MNTYLRLFSISLPFLQAVVGGDIVTGVITVNTGPSTECMPLDLLPIILGRLICVSRVGKSEIVVGIRVPVVGTFL